MCKDNYDDEDYDPITEAVGDRPDDDVKELDFSDDSELGWDREISDKEWEDVLATEEYLMDDDIVAEFISESEESVIEKAYSDHTQPSYI